MVKSRLTICPEGCNQIIVRGNVIEILKDRDAFRRECPVGKPKAFDIVQQISPIAANSHHRKSAIVRECSERGTVIIENSDILASTANENIISRTTF